MACPRSPVLLLLALCCLATTATASPSPSFSLPRVLRIYDGSSDVVLETGAAAGDRNDPRALSMAPLLSPGGLPQPLPTGVAPSEPRVEGTDDPSMDDIVRVGKEIWDVVEENRGVIDYTTDYSGAVPRAAAGDPFAMTGWVNQDVKGWRWRLVNGYNSTVVDFGWALKANVRGQYAGAGAFLDHVTTVVADIYAAWGFHVSVKAHADEPYNAGTLGAPIAVQELQVTMEVTTALDTRIDNCRVRFFGDGRPPQCVQCATYAC